MKKAIIGALILSVGLGIGFVGALGMLISDHPTIVKEEIWRTVTTAPPTPPDGPETPFHADPETICRDYVPPTTTTTSAPVPVVPVTQAPTTTVTTPTLPPSTLPPSSTTSTSETTTSETVKPGNQN